MSQFGQPPLAAYLPLRAGQNLADLPDKAAALANLGTLSTSDIMMNAVPIGTIIAHWGNTAPAGYLPCNGQTVNSGTFPDLVTFLGGTTSAVLPDLRGEFLRGWDNGRGIDAGRTNLSTQTDALQNIIAGLASRPLTGGSFGSIYSATGAFNGVSGNGAAGAVTSVTAAGTGLNPDVFTFDASRVVRTSTETRPHNVSVLYCIKAYGALVNTATANIGNVLTELSNCTKLTQFGSGLSTSGYQRLPSGIIIQWGQGTAVTAGGGGGGTGCTVTFPISFPTVLLQSVVSVDQTTNLVTSAWADAQNVLSMRLTTNGINGSIVRYIAIGY